MPLPDDVKTSQFADLPPCSVCGDDAEYTCGVCDAALCENHECAVQHDYFAGHEPD